MKETEIKINEKSEHSNFLLTKGLDGDIQGLKLLDIAVYDQMTLKEYSEFLNDISTENKGQ